MNATQSMAGSLREFLLNSNPAVWAQVVRNGLHGAVCWTWPETKMRDLHFQAYDRTPLSTSLENHGMLDLPGADPTVPPAGDHPWAGLPIARLRCWESIQCAQSKHHEDVELAYGLNQAMASWLSRAYTPQTADETSFHGSVLIKRAAHSGEIEQMYGVFRNYGYYGRPKAYVPALRTAAQRKDRAFAAALCEQISGLAEQAYSRCKADGATPEDKECILALYEVGVPVPPQYAIRATLWMGEALAQRGNRKNGVRTQNVRA